MFKFKNIAEKDLLKIYALQEHEIQNSDKKNFIVRNIPKTDLVMPHDSYLIGLSSLQIEGYPTPELTGMQVIDASSSRFNTIFNLYPDKDNNNQLQMLKDRKYLKSYEKAFDKIFNLEGDDSDFEVRSIKIPALHVEALWLHKEHDEGSDQFKPIRSMGLFEENKMYDRKEFFNILKVASEKFDLGDDLIGG